MKTASWGLGDNLGMYSLKAVRVSLFAIRFRGHGGLKQNGVWDDTLWVRLVNFSVAVKSKFQLSTAST